MTLAFSLVSTPVEATDSDCLVIGVFEDGTLPAAAAAVDKASGGALQRRIDAGDISGKRGTQHVLYDLDGIQASRVLVAGLGKAAKFDAAAFKKAAATAARTLADMPTPRAASWLAQVDVLEHDAHWRLRTEALAVDHACYRYTATLNKRRPQVGVKLQSLALAGDANAQPALDEAAAMAEGVRFAREVGNTPANICTPIWLAEQASAFADQHDGVSATVLDADAMDDLGMHSLLAVGRGSTNPPRLIVLEWSGGNTDDAPYALVGKGVTFDSGGLNIKPGAGMESMKFDMCGAAGMLGTFVAAVTMRLPVNLVCVVPSVENMPDAAAYRPGDVLTTLSGQTVEVRNTDAEGRLILCDALTYVQRHNPQAIIDAATLTGACMVALGKPASGLMSKHDDLADELLTAGENTLDRAWRLPLWDEYQSELDSAFADFAHLGGRNAGATLAGCFLSRFTEGQRWAHLDIAGTAWDDGRQGLATGRPVNLLTQWLMDRADD